MGPACLRPTEASAPGGQLRVGTLTSSGHLSKLQCPGCGRGCGDRPHSPLLLLSASEEAARRQFLASLALMRDRIVPQSPGYERFSSATGCPSHPTLCPCVPSSGPAAFSIFPVILCRHRADTLVFLAFAGCWHPVYSAWSQPAGTGVGLGGRARGRDPRKGMWVPPGGQIVAHQRLCPARSYSPRAGSCLPGLYLLGGRTSQRPWRLAGAEGCWDTGCGLQVPPPPKLLGKQCGELALRLAPRSPPFPAPPLSPHPHKCSSSYLPSWNRSPTSAPSEGVSGKCLWLGLDSIQRTPSQRTRLEPAWASSNHA